MTINFSCMRSGSVSGIHFACPHCFLIWKFTTLSNTYSVHCQPPGGVIPLRACEALSGFKHWCRACETPSGADIVVWPWLCLIIWPSDVAIGIVGTMLMLYILHSCIIISYGDSYNCPLDEHRLPHAALAFLCGVLKWNKTQLFPEISCDSLSYSICLYLCACLCLSHVFMYLSGIGFPNEKYLFKYYPHGERFLMQVSTENIM